MLETYIADLRETKDELTELNERVKAVKKQQAHIEGLIEDAMMGEGLQKASSDLGTVSLKEGQYPQIEDWDEALEYIMNHCRHVLKREIKSAAYKELLDSGEAIPGVRTYDKTKINFRRK